MLCAQCNLDSAAKDVVEVCIYKDFLSLKRYPLKDHANFRWYTVHVSPEANGLSCDDVRRRSPLLNIGPDKYAAVRNRFNKN
jgi:hypothetical protein